MAQQKTKKDDQEIPAETQTDLHQESPVDSTEDVGQNQEAKNHILKSFELDKSSKSKIMSNTSPKIIAVMLVVAVIAGIGTGYGGYKLQAKSGSNFSPIKKSSQNIEQVAGETIAKGDVFGVEDENTFKDSAQGILQLGGLEGEGSHSLLREGGESQTVYMTSSITDLDKFEGMEVKVWGETFKGQKAGWLMDVGRVEVINPQAEPPAEAE